jgi:hypothetical protein
MNYAFGINMNMITYLCCHNIEYYGSQYTFALILETV